MSNYKYILLEGRVIFDDIYDKMTRQILHNADEFNLKVEER